MTTDQALEWMKEIAKKYEKHPKQSYAEAKELVCKILRRTGFYQTAEIFEKMNDHK